MSPVFRAILDEDLLLGVGAGWVTLATGWCDSPKEAALEVVGEGPAHVSLDLGKAVLLEGLLGVF